MSYERKITCPVCRSGGQDIEIVKKKTYKQKVSFYRDFSIEFKYICKKCGFKFNR